MQSTRPWAEQQQAQHRGLESKALSSGEKTPRSTGHSFRAVPPDLLNPRYTSSLWHSPAAGTRGALPGFAKSSVMQSQSFTWGLMLTALLPSMPGVWLLPTLQSERVFCSLCNATHRAALCFKTKLMKTQKPNGAPHACSAAASETYLEQQCQAPPKPEEQVLGSL